MPFIIFLKMFEPREGSSCRDRHLDPTLPVARQLQDLMPPFNVIKVNLGILGVVQMRMRQEEGDLHAAALQLFLPKSVGRHRHRIRTSLKTRMTARDNLTTRRRGGVAGMTTTGLS